MNHTPSLSPEREPDLEPSLERLARRRAKAKMGFFTHALIYLAVNAGLTLLALSKGQHWSVWPATGWGFGLLMHALAVFGLGRGSGLHERVLARERERLRGKTSTAQTAD